MANWFDSFKKLAARGHIPFIMSNNEYNGTHNIMRRLKPVYKKYRDLQPCLLKFCLHVHYTFCIKWMKKPYNLWRLLIKDEQDNNAGNSETDLLEFLKQSHHPM